MTAASVAALTVYDMVKGVERGVEIRGVRLVSKTGGKSGTWIRQAPPTGRGRRPGRAPARESPVGWGRSARATGEPSVSEPPLRSALVITASDGAAAGVREDAIRRASRGAPRGAGLRRRAARGRRRAMGDRGRPRRGDRRLRPRRHDRWHRTDATRRDAAGHPGRHRLRGPRPRRGDARRRPGEHATRRPVARRRRRPRSDASSSTCPAARRARSNRSMPSRRVLDHALDTLAGPYDHAITPGGEQRQGG